MDSARGSLESLRLGNRRAVLDALTRKGVLSRADIARHTGLSRTTVSGLVHELIRDGVVTESTDRTRPHKGGSGRPPTVLTLGTPPGVVVGVDLGHRHVRVAAADLASNVLAEQHVDLDVDHDAARALDTVVQLLGRVLDGADADLDRVRAVGMGVPGPVDIPAGRVTSPILAGWRGMSPGEELRRRLGVTVRLDNDANAGALGELTYGAAQGFADVIYLKIAGGLGAGLVLGGRLHHGATGIAGEIGHVQIREDGAVCRCGSRGCLETQVSAPKLVDVLQPAHDQVLTVESLLRLSDQGDAGVNRVLNDAGRTIGRVLADLCNNLNPAALVVGGDLGTSQTLLSGIRDSVDRYAQPAVASAVRVRPGALGERAELMGALAMALETEEISG
ncbi:MAG: ROK family transcriptional regulator [Actinomycetota bacterium]|nr:ROK family transcriptional regulator [Actinomycetota bacterium]